MIWILTSVVLLAWAVRGTYRENRLLQALILEVIRDDWIGWAEFRDKTGLSRAYRGAFIIIVSYLVRRRELVANRSPYLPRTSVVYRRALRPTDLRPG